jgi:putative transposase
MLFAAVLTMLALLCDLLHAMTRGEHDKTLEIVVRRQQLRRYARTASAKPHRSRWDKLVLATIVAKYRALASALVLVQPETALRWHRAIVRRKWTYGNTPKRGRPTIAADTVELSVREGYENLVPR